MRNIFLRTAPVLLLAGAMVVPPSPALHAATSDPVIAAAGDIACDPNSPKFNADETGMPLGTNRSCRMKYTSDYLASLGSGLKAVLTLGDNQYTDGALWKFQASYDLTWGRDGLFEKTHPTPGDHDYRTTGAADYFTYFGSKAKDPATGKSYYSFDVATSDAENPWHVISLNAKCGQAGGCKVGSTQYKWLVADLAAHPTTCTLAYWYKPRFSSGEHGSYTTYRPFWEALHAAGADVVLGAHDHDYEEFAPQDPDGVAVPNGIREFIVGTGGASTRPFGTDTFEPNSVYRQIPGRFGVLTLTLHPTSYDWGFRGAGGGELHGGSAPCVS